MSKERQVAEENPVVSCWNLNLIRKINHKDFPKNKGRSLADRLTLCGFDYYYQLTQSSESDLVKKELMTRAGMSRRFFSDVDIKEIEYVLRCLGLAFDMNLPQECKAWCEVHVDLIPGLQ